jgi:hypothetical protein
MDGLMLTTLFIGVIGFTCTFAWLVSHRQRVMAMRDILLATQLDSALDERIAEGGRA